MAAQNIKQRRRSCNNNNETSSEELQQKLEALSLHTLRELEPVMNWFEQHNEQYDMFGAIKQVMNDKLNNACCKQEEKEEEPSPEQFPDNEDRIFDPAYLSSTLQNITEKTIQNANTEKKFAKLISKHQCKEDGLNTKTIPFVPESTNAELKANFEEKENGTMRSTSLDSHIFLWLIGEIIQKLNAQTGKTKLNGLALKECIKANHISLQYFKDRTKKKQFFELLKQCGAKMQRAQALWDEICNIYADEIRKFDVCDMPKISKEKSMMYISENTTKNSLKIVQKHFKTATELFHYLKWYIKMQQIDDFYKIFENYIGFQIILFNVELCTQSGDGLYALGIRNNKTNPLWKMVTFITAKQIENQYNIAASQLPLPSRKYDQIPARNTNNYKQNLNYHISKSAYAKLFKIRTSQKQCEHKRNPNKFIMNGTQFNECVAKAIHSNDIRNKCISVIAFGKQKMAYFCDTILPVQISRNNWIGIMFRNNKSVAICVDCNDIKTKAKLYDLNFDKRKYAWMQNNITRLYIEYGGSKKPSKIKRQVRKYPDKYEGFVSSFFAEKKYGFITSYALKSDIFFLETDIRSRISKCMAGLRVEFFIGTNLYKGKGLKAINVCCV